MISISFRTTHPQNPLMLYELSIVPTLVEVDSMALEARIAFATGNITSGEFWGCTIGLGISVLSEYGGILKDLKWLVQNGANSWGAVFDLAYDLVKNSCPWFKVVGMALSYAACLWAQEVLNLKS